MAGGIVQILYPPVLNNDILGVYLEFTYTTNTSANTTTISARYIVSKYKRYTPYYTGSATDPTYSNSPGWACYVTINGSSGPAKRIKPFSISPKGIHGANGTNIPNISISGSTGAVSGGNSGTTDQTSNVQLSNFIYLTDWYSRTLSHSSTGALTISVTGQFASHKYSGNGNTYKQLPTVNINASYSRIPEKPSAPSMSFPSATADGGKFFYGDVTYSVTATGPYTRFVVEPTASYGSNSSGWLSSTKGTTKSYTVNLSDFPEGVYVGGSVRCANTNDYSSMTDSSIAYSDYMRNYRPTMTVPSPISSYISNDVTFISSTPSFASTVSDRGGWDIGYPQSCIQFLNSNGEWINGSFQTGQGQKSHSVDISEIPRGSFLDIRGYVTDGYDNYTSESSSYCRAYLDIPTNISSSYENKSWITYGDSFESFSWSMPNNSWYWFDHAEIFLEYIRNNEVVKVPTTITNIQPTNNSCSAVVLVNSSNIPYGTTSRFSINVYNKFNEVATAYYPSENWEDSPLKINYPPTDPVLISPDNNSYFEDTFNASWEASTDQGGGTISYVIEEYIDGSWIQVYNGSGTTTDITLSDVDRGTIINYRLYATDGYNNSNYVPFNIIKNTLPIVNQSDSTITVWNVFLDSENNYTFQEAVSGTILDQTGISFLPGYSDSTPEDELRYRPYFKIVRNNVESIVEGSTLISRIIDSPSIISLSSYGIAPTDNVTIMLAVVDKFGIQSNEDESITKNGYITIV